MKTTYFCDYCGKAFDNWETCHNHEKLCEETHATGTRIARELNAAIETAATTKTPIGIASTDDNQRLYKLVSIEYNPKFKRIEIRVDYDESIGYVQNAKETTKEAE